MFPCCQPGTTPKYHNLSRNQLVPPQRSPCRLPTQVHRGDALPRQTRLRGWKLVQLPKLRAGASHLGRAQTNNDFLKSENVPNVLPPQWHDGWHLTIFEEPLIQSCVKPAPLVPDKLARKKVRKRKVEEETGLIMNWRTQTHWSTNLFRIWMIAEYSIHLWYHSLQMYSSTLTLTLTRICTKQYDSFLEIFITFIS